MRDCNAQMSDRGGTKSPATLSNRTEDRLEDCHTSSSHQRSERGLWLRGSMYQFRVKVPVDLRDALGRVDVNRSLRADSRSLAIRLSCKVAAEVDAMFEAKRLETGLPIDARLLPSGALPATVEKTIQRRSQRASEATIGLTLSQTYDRYLADPAKRRSARTMLAHHTTRRMVEGVLGANTPTEDISRELCRDLLETLRWLCRAP